MKQKPNLQFHVAIAVEKLILITSTVFFVCEKVYAIASKFLEVLKIFDPAYSFEEVIKLKSKEEFPHVNWFIAYTLYYIYDNRKRCSLNHYITFLQTEYEVLKFSKKQNIEEEIRVLNMMIELLQNDSY